MIRDMKRRWLAFLCSSIFGVACRDAANSATSHPRPLVVFAAASMTDVLRELGDRFEAREHVRVEINSAATGILFRQIEQGAACDVFVSADAAHMDQLAKAGRIDPATRRNIASNELVVVARGAAAHAWSSADQLTNPDVDRIATGNPEYVPAGSYAREALRRAGLWEAVRPKLVFTDNVRLALDAVRSGSVRYAIAYLSDAGACASCRVVFRFEPASHSPIQYPAAVMQGAAAAHPKSDAFCQFLASEDARQAMRRYGFVAPEDRMPSPGTADAHCTGN